MSMENNSPNPDLPNDGEENGTADTSSTFSEEENQMRKFYNYFASENPLSKLNQPNDA